MATLTEGDWACTVLGATVGMDDKEQLVVRVNVKIEDGPDKGKTCMYEDTISNKSAPYIARTCRAIGWKGAMPFEDTLVADVDAWVKETGGKTTVSIKHLDIKRGKAYDKWAAGGFEGPGPVWAKVQGLGRGAKPLAAPNATAKKDANDFMRAAMADDAPPEDEVPHAAVTDDQIPF